MTRALPWVLAVLVLATQLGSIVICAPPSAMRVGSPGQTCAGDCAPIALEVGEVEQIVAQGVVEAQRLGVAATIAVVDRVGNALAVYQMPGATGSPGPGIGPAPFSAIGLSPPGCLPSPKSSAAGQGLEGAQVSQTLAAISKAGTGAYLSSQGNAFTSRSASQIVQEHFNPQERFRPGGPLFGVQFSQLPCGDLVRRFPADGSLGPKRMPLGLSADPGGLPLYIWGVPVGGVGVEFDGCYTADPSIFDFDVDFEERIAAAAANGFAAPPDRRADRIAVDGRFLRFADDLGFAPATAPPLASLPGALVDVDGYFDAAGGIQPGALHQSCESGIATATLNGLPAEILVNGCPPMGNERYPPTDSLVPGGPTAAEVKVVLSEALRVASRARAQIRRPAGTSARVTVSVVDTSGAILGVARTLDAPIFGIDVSLQKARTAAFFSSANAAGDLTAAGLGSYVAAAKSFLGPTALEGGIAFSDRAGGNLSRPFFPDGIDGRGNGPLSLPFPSWSPFATGLQLDIAIANLVDSLTTPVPGQPSCADPALSELPNGIQIFPGSVPIYRGSTLVGGIGVSGDGVDQDDLISFLGLHDAGLALGGALGNAPPGIRADQLRPQGLALRFVNCPFSPFIDSNQQNVCDGK